MPTEMNPEMNKEERTSAIESRRQQIEREFTYEGMKYVRKELFANNYDPSLTIRDGNITFNMACIRGLEDVVYINIMFNEEIGRLVVKPCQEDDEDALRWCVAKDGKRKSRKMRCPDFTDMLYENMGWDKAFRYKLLGYRIDVEGEKIYVFDFDAPKVFHEKKKGQGAETLTSVDRKGYYPEEIAKTFGVPVEEHEQKAEVKDYDGFVSYGMITGGKKEKLATDEKVSDEMPTTETNGGAEVNSGQVDSTLEGSFPAPNNVTF